MKEIVRLTTLSEIESLFQRRGAQACIPKEKVDRAVRLLFTADPKFRAVVEALAQYVIATVQGGDVLNHAASVLGGVTVGERAAERPDVREEYDAADALAYAMRPGSRRERERANQPYFGHPSQMGTPESCKALLDSPDPGQGQ